MRSMKELLPENKTLHIWIYGAPGVGKTKSALKVATLGRTMFLAVETGILKHHLDGIDMKNLTLIGSDNMNDLNNIYNKLKDFQEAAWGYIKTGDEKQKIKAKGLDEWFNSCTYGEDYVPRPYLFFVLDTLTDLQKDTIVHLMPRDVKDFSKPKQLQIQHWGSSNAMLDMITDALVKQETPYTDLRLNTVWISHEKKNFDKEGNLESAHPALSGQNPKLIGAKMDVEAYCLLKPTNAGMVQEMKFQRKGLYQRYDLKDRTDGLGEALADKVSGDGTIIVRIMKNFGWIPSESELAYKPKEIENK